MPAARRQDGALAQSAESGTPPPPPVAISAEATPPPDLSSLPLWQRRYIGALCSGLDDADAALSAGVTRATISDWTTPGARRYNPAFARADALARQGQALVGAPELRSRSLQYVSVALDDALKESRGIDPATGARATRTVYAKDGSSWTEDAILPRDRLGNRRYLSDVAGVTGTPVQAGAAVQVSVTVQVLAQVQALDPDARALALAKLVAEYPNA